MANAFFHHADLSTGIQFTHDQVEAGRGRVSHAAVFMPRAIADTYLTDSLRGLPRSAQDVISLHNTTGKAVLEAGLMSAGIDSGRVKKLVFDYESLLTLNQRKRDPFRPLGAINYELQMRGLVPDSWSGNSIKAHPSAFQLVVLGNTLISMSHLLDTFTNRTEGSVRTEDHDSPTYERLSWTTHTRTPTDDGARNLGYRLRTPAPDALAASFNIVPKVIDVDETSVAVFPGVNLHASKRGRDTAFFSNTIIIDSDVKPNHSESVAVRLNAADLIGGGDNTLRRRPNNGIVGTLANMAMLLQAVNKS